MKKVVNGHTILIDDEDVDKIKGYSIWVHHTKMYVYIEKTVDFKRERYRLHRFLIDAPQDKYVDHINMNRLDNRKKNLRLCTNSQNLANTGLRKQNTSGYKGVSRSYSNSPKKWRARIQHKFIGYYYTAEEASEAYNKEAKIIYGKFARLK
jgi:hypothetical protein